MSASSVISDLVAGKIQREGRANLANPWVKLVLFVLPAVIGWYLAFRSGVYYPSLGLGSAAGSVDLTPFSLLALGIWLSQSIDFRPGDRGRTFCHTAVVLVLGVLVVLDHFAVVPFTRIAAYPLVGDVVALVGEVTSGPRLLGIAFLGIAARGFLRIYPTDALAISRILFVERFMRGYKTLVVLYYVIVNSVGRRFVAARTAMSGRFRLMRGRGARRVAAALLVFGKRLLQELRDMARVCQSVLQDRGWYEREFSGAVGQPLNDEDVVAILVLCFFAGVSILLVIF